MKKTWEKPKLIVLARSRPEEYIITACKLPLQAGPGDVENGCYIMPVAVCVTCPAHTGT